MPAKPASRSREPSAAPDLQATRETQRRYARLARIYDLQEWFIERLAFGRWRRALWSGVPAGRVLEVGVGTGKNAPYYPRGARVSAVDLTPAMAERAARRIDRLGAVADVAVMDTQRLGFAGQRFDSVIATFVFCSVPDPVLGLREIRRVLRPGGRLYLLEHVRAENAVMGWIMDRINPIAVRLSGANINRRTVDNVRAAGFDVRSVESHAGVVRVIEAAPLQ